MSDALRRRLEGLMAARERGSLTVSEERELLDILHENPEMAADAGRDLAVERLLRYSLTAELSGEEFTRGVSARIAAEKRGEDFVRRVSRESRRLRTLRPVSPPRTSGFVFASAAACAGVLLLAAVLNRGKGVEGRSATPIVVADAPAEISETTPVERREVLVREVEREPARPVPEASAADSRRREGPPRRQEPIAPAPTPVAAPEIPRTTIAVVGVVERSEGNEGLSDGQPLLAGQVVETADWKAKAVLRLNDGTRIELEPATALGLPAAGKRFFVAKGTLLAEVVAQPGDQALVFETPHGEATVLGTSLRLVVESSSTRLEVTEGKVRLSRAGDGKSVEVAAGHFALAAAGAEMKAKPMPDPRVTEGLRALYLFEEGKGRVIRDVSGVGTPLHLVAKDESALGWIPGGGLTLRSPTLVASSGPAAKILGACRTSRAMTVEAWVRPAQVEPATLRYLVALSGARKEALAFGLGLHVGVGGNPVTYRIYLSTPRTVPASDYIPELESKPIVPGLAHVVFTRAASGSAVLYVDGQEWASGPIEGDFSTWNDTLRLMLGGHSFEGERPWVGEFHLVAFYSRALKPEEVLQNLAAGKRKFSAPKK